MKKFNDIPEELIQHVLDFLDDKELHNNITCLSKNMRMQAKNVIYRRDIKLLRTQHSYLSEDEAALFINAQAGNLPRLKTIFAEKKLDVNVQLHFESSTEEAFITPIHEAAYAGALDCVKFLIEKGAVYKPSNPKEYYIAPLHYAAAGGSAACLAYFLDNMKMSLQNQQATTNEQKYIIPVDLQTTICCELGWNWTALQIAASHGREQCVKLLIANHADVNFADPDMYRAIHRACQGEHYGCLQLLLDNGADPNVSTEEGLTPLLIAVSEGYYKCAELLLQRKANTKTMSLFIYRSATILQIAAHEKNLTMAKLLLEYDKTLINLRRFPDSDTPLHIAVKTANEAMVQLFLDPKYAIDLTLKADGKTAAELAQELNHTKILQLFAAAKSHLTTAAKESKETPVVTTELKM